MSGLDAGVEKLRAEGAGDAAIASFRHYYELLESGERGCSPRATSSRSRRSRPSTTSPRRATSDVLDRAVVLKLNGGLGTSMGMTGPSRCSR